MKRLWKMICNIFRSKTNAAADALADPERDGKLAIEDSKKQIDEFTGKIKKLKASDNMLVKEIADLEEKSKKFDRIAKKAAEKSDENAVREALKQKGPIATKLAAKKKQHADNDKLEDALMKQRDKAREKIEKAESDIDSLAARKESASLRKEMADASTTFEGSNSGLGQIDDFQKAVAKEEAEAEAAEEVAGADSLADDILAKYDGGGDEDLDDEVAKMMAKGKKK